MTLADRIVVLQAGNVIQYDTPDAIYNRPAAKFVAGFTGSPPMNFLPCRVGEGGRTLHLPGSARSPGSGRARRRMRAPCGPLVDVRIASGAHQRRRLGRARGVPPLPVSVMLVEPLGSDTLGLIRLGLAGDAGEMTGRFPPEVGLTVGQTLPVSLAMNRFHLFDPDTGVAIRGATW